MLGFGSSIPRCVFVLYQLNTGTTLAFINYNCKAIFETSCANERVFAESALMQGVRSTALLQELAAALNGISYFSATWRQLTDPPKRMYFSQVSCARIRNGFSSRE
jgi:hypothetical protein